MRRLISILGLVTNGPERFLSIPAMNIDIILIALVIVLLIWLFVSKW